MSGKPEVWEASCPIEYEKDGTIRTRWVPCGVAFVKDDKIAITLNTLPLNGKLYLFPKQKTES